MSLLMPWWGTNKIWWNPLNLSLLMTGPYLQIMTLRHWQLVWYQKQCKFTASKNSDLKILAKILITVYHPSQWNLCTHIRIIIKVNKCKYLRSLLKEQKKVPRAKITTHGSLSIVKLVSTEETKHHSEKHYTNLPGTSSAIPIWNMDTTESIPK